MTETKNNVSSLTTPGDSDSKFKPDTSPPLEGTELDSAVSTLENTSFTEKFKVSDRNYADPPIASQKIGLFSFVPAKGARPNNNGVYGFAKLRGNFETENEANIRAEHIIRTSDSAHTIFHTYVGKPFPITENENYAAETSEVDIRRETTEAVSNSIKDKKSDDKRIAKEIKEREDELMRDTSKEGVSEDEVNEDEYITLNIKKAQLTWTYLEHIKKMKDVRSILLATADSICKIDTLNPALKQTFLDKYILAREKAGLSHDKKDFKEGFVRYLVEDVTLPGIEFDDPSKMAVSAISSEDLNDDSLRLASTEQTSKKSD